MQEVGLIVKSFGRQFIVELKGIDYQAVTRAKKTDYVVGDKVHVDIINQEQLQIIDLVPRTTLVYRIDHNRSKMIASNVTTIYIVIAAKPNFDEEFLNNCLVFAESSEIRPVILINKIDLPESTDLITRIESLYGKKLGYNTQKLMAVTSCEELKLQLTGTSILIGQSGVGKTTITNQVIPHAKSKTGDLGKNAISGCHTTTNASLYHIDNESDLIDCPGLQGFGLYDLPLDGLISFFPEFRGYLGKCKFNNCRHLNEPGCGIIADQDQFDKFRFRYLQRLTQILLKKNNV